MTFEELTSLINQKHDLAKQIEAIRKQISDINIKIEDPVQELFRPFVGKYFKKLKYSKRPSNGLPECEWFYIVDIPRSTWAIMFGCEFDEYRIPVKFMQLDGMLREGSISISPNNFQDNGTKMPCSIIEITADEWFDEQKRRIQEDADRRFNQLKNDNGQSWR